MPPLFVAQPKQEEHMFVSYGHDLGPNQVNKEPGLLGTLASLLTREGRLVSYFNVLKEGGQRDTPAVVLKGEEGFVEVLAAPTEQQDGWLLGDGRLKSTRDILELDTMRALAGYS
jgi:hypothetical protein